MSCIIKLAELAEQLRKKKGSEPDELIGAIHDALRDGGIPPAKRKRLLWLADRIGGIGGFDLSAAAIRLRQIERGEL